MPKNNFSFVSVCIEYSRSAQKFFTCDQKMNDSSNFRLFWREIYQSCTRSFFSKKSRKNWFFSKTQRQITFVQKMSFWGKTQQQIEFLCPENFEILCYDLSNFSKNPKNDLFFAHLVPRNLSKKNQFLKSKSIILHTNYEKKVDFVKFFQKKIHFFQIFCQIFHFFSNKASFLEHRMDFMFIFSPILEEKKFSFFVKGKFFSVPSKKTFCLD